MRVPLFSPGSIGPEKRDSVCTAALSPSINSHRGGNGTRLLQRVCVCVCAPLINESHKDD